MEYNDICLYEGEVFLNQLSKYRVFKEGLITKLYWCVKQFFFCALSDVIHELKNPSFNFINELDSYNNYDNYNIDEDITKYSYSEVSNNNKLIYNNVLEELKRSYAINNYNKLNDELKYTYSKLMFNRSMNELKYTYSKLMFNRSMNELKSYHDYDIIMDDFN